VIRQFRELPHADQQQIIGFLESLLVHSFAMPARQVSTT